MSIQTAKEKVRQRALKLYAEKKLGIKPKTDTRTAPLIENPYTGRSTSYADSASNVPKRVQPVQQTVEQPQEPQQAAPSIREQPKRTLGDVARGITDKAKLYQGTIRQLPEAAAEVAGKVGALPGKIAGGILGGGTGFLTGLIASGGDLKRAAQSAKETAKFGGDIVGGVTGGIAEFPLHLADRFLDVSEAGINTISGKEDDLIDYTADEFQKVYNTDVSKMGGLFGLEPGVPLTKKQVKNQLTTGNLEGDKDNTDPWEIAKAWSSALTATGIDAFFGMSIMKGALKNQFKGKDLTLLEQTEAAGKTIAMLNRLDLAPGASKSQIRSAYYKKAQEVHPDKTGGDSAAFKKVTEANEWLKKNYNPKIKDVTKRTTPQNQEHIDNLRALGLKWGDSRREVSLKYESLVKEGKATKGQTAAYNNLMRGENKYNPYQETNTYMERKAATERPYDPTVEAKYQMDNAVSRAISRTAIPMEERLARFQPESQLAAGSAGAPFYVAPVDTPQAAFQMVDPTQQKRIIDLSNKLTELKNKKQAVIDAGRGGEETKIAVAKIQDLIESAQNKLQQGQMAATRTTGPLRETEPVRPTIIGTQAPQATRAIQQPASAISETISSVKDTAGQKAIAEALEPKKETQILKQTSKPTTPKTATVKTTKPKSYKELVAAARVKDKPKTSSAVERVLGGRTRESIVKTAPKQAPVSAARISKPKTTISGKLAEMKRAGTDIGQFAEMSRQKYLDFLEGKTKTDESIAIDDFINENMASDAERLYSQKAARQVKPEGREIKTPTTSKLKSLFSKKKEFKLYNEMGKLISKYANLASEKKVGRGRAGVYRPKSGNIGVKSMNNVQVTTHEVAHSLDFKLGIIDKVVANNDAKAIRDLGKIYTEYYNPNKTLSSKDILREGYATLIEMNALIPEQIAKDYPFLVESFIKSTGKYYDKLVGEAIGEVNQVIAKYLSLTALEQEKAKMVFNKREASGKSIYTLEDYAIKHAVDYVRPMEALAKANGLDGTASDPSVFYRLIDTVPRIAISNMTRPDGYYITDKIGTPIKKFEYNWYTLGTDVSNTGAYQDYSAYLGSRRLYEVAENVKRLEDKDILTEFEQDVLSQEKSILERSNPDMENIKMIVEDNAEAFADFNKQFDAMANEPVRLLMDSGLISKDYGNYLINKKGYATFARSVIDEVEGGAVDGVFTSGRKDTTPSTMRKFKGSEKALIDPFVTTAKAQSYIGAKVMLQTTLEKLYELDPKGEIEIVGRRAIGEDEVTFFPTINGNMVQFRYKDEWVDMQISNQLKDVFDTGKAMRETDRTHRVIKAFSNVFVKATTGIMYPAFAITNVAIDWVPAAAQSKNFIIPIVDGVRYMSMAGLGKNTKISEMSPNMKKYRELWEQYKVASGLGNTLVRQYEDDPYKTLRSAKIVKDGLVDYIGWTGDKIGNAMAYVGERTETMNRFAEYVKGIEAGKIHAVALEEANRVTGAFSHRGKMLGKHLRAWEDSIVYANSTKQYIYSALKAVRDKDTRKKALTVRLIAGGMSAAGFLYMLNQYNNAVENGTGEEKEQAQSLMNDYLNQNAYGLENHIYTMHGDLKELTKVRIAGNYNEVGLMLNMAMAEAFLDKKYSWKDYAVSIKNIYTPNQYDVTKWKEAATSWIPQIIKPMVEIAMNAKTFPEYKELESEYMRKKPSEERYYPWTSDLAIMLGQTDLMKTQGLSPIQIEHYIKATAGRGTDALTKYIDEGVLSGPLKGLGETFTRIVKNETYLFTGAGYSEFYDGLTKAESDYKKAKESRVGPDIERASRVKKTYSGVEKQLRKLRKINSNEDVVIPTKIPNAIFRVVDLLNKEEYDEAIKEYQTEAGIVGSYIADNKELTK